MGTKMKIEIWSDIVCPFCYIGKRKFETALESFADRNNVQIEWKSFELMPHLKTQPGKNIDEILAEEKGMPLAQANALNNQVAQMAKQVGLDYHFDKAIPANTFKAHQLIQFAKTQGKQGEAEEALFRAYFTEGKNLEDLATLVEIGAALGLDKTALKTALENGTYADNVHADINEARQLGVRGVPFFVFNRKYAVSGAQDPRVFAETLQGSFAEWRKENPENKLQIVEGAVCTPGGECK